MKPLNIVFWVIGAFVVIFPSSVWWFLWEQESQRVKAPNVGDVASAFSDIVSPIFAALAFAGLVYTALMQREELVLQREQLKESQAELKRQADAQEGSGKILSSQVDVARLSAQLSAAQALYGYYSTILMNSLQIPWARMHDFLIAYKDKVAAYDSSNVSKANLSAHDVEQEFEKLQAALEVQIDEAVRDMQRVQAELRRATTAELNVMQKPQTIEPPTTTNI